MRSIEEVRRVQALIEEGLNDCEISREIRIPRGTVRDWRHGKTPRRGPNGARIPPAESCAKCGHPAHDFHALPQYKYTYLLGLYLGDGCLSAARRGVFRLRITLDSRYPGIIEECRRAMAEVMPASKAAVLRHKHQNSVEVGSFSRAWPCLFPEHGPGRKHLREIRLTPWQQEIVDSDPRPLLRGLIHSDGCHSVNTIKHPKRTYAYPRYLFSNRSSHIRRIFCEACDQLGIEWRVMTETDISIARCESVALMDEFIGPKE